MYELHPIIKIILTGLEIVHLIVLIYVILNLLLQFKVINSQNQFIMKIYLTLSSYIEPVLNKIRKYLPAKGNLDFSPLILLVGISLLSYTIGYYAS